MTVQSPKKKILLLEDNPAIREVARCRLESQDYVVMTAGDGIQGLEILGQERPHVILLDVKMPRMDGWSFLKKIKADDKLRDIPVIVLTAHDQLEDLFRPEGVYDYIIKPYEPDILLEKLRKFFEDHPV